MLARVAAWSLAMAADRCAAAAAEEGDAAGTIGAGTGAEYLLGERLRRVAAFVEAIEELELLVTVPDTSPAREESSAARLYSAAAASFSAAATSSAPAIMARSAAASWREPSRAW